MAARVVGGRWEGGPLGLVAVVTPASEVWVGAVAVLEAAGEWWEGAPFRGVVAVGRDWQRIRVRGEQGLAPAAAGRGWVLAAPLAGLQVVVAAAEMGQQGAWVARARAEAEVGSGWGLAVAVGVAEPAVAVADLAGVAMPAVPVRAWAMAAAAAAVKERGPVAVAAAEWGAAVASCPAQPRPPRLRPAPLAGLRRCDPAPHRSAAAWTALPGRCAEQQRALCLAETARPPASDLQTQSYSQIRSLPFPSNGTARKGHPAVVRGQVRRRRAGRRSSPSSPQGDRRLTR